MLSLVPVLFPSSSSQVTRSPKVHSLSITAETKPCWKDSCLPNTTFQLNWLVLAGVKRFGMVLICWCKKTHNKTLKHTCQYLPATISHQKCHALYSKRHKMYFETTKLTQPLLNTSWSAYLQKNDTVATWEAVFKVSKSVNQLAKMNRMTWHHHLILFPFQNLAIILVYGQPSSKQAT